MAVASPMTASHPLPDDGSEQAPQAEEQVANGRTDVYEITIPQAQEVCINPSDSGLQARSDVRDQLAIQLERLCHRVTTDERSLAHSCPVLILDLKSSLRASRVPACFRASEYQSAVRQSASSRFGAIYARLQHFMLLPMVTLCHDRS